MAKLKIKAFPDADNIESFTVQNDGIDYDLDANGVTKVEVYVCGGFAALVDESCRMISSDTDAVTYSGTTLNVKFGKIGVPAGIYYPKVKLYLPASPTGIVVTGQDMATEIVMDMGC